MIPKHLDVILLGLDLEGAQMPQRKKLGVPSQSYKGRLELTWTNNLDENY